MSAKGNTFEADIAKLVFQAVSITNIASDIAAAPLANLFVSLHTANPGEAGTQATSEGDYTGITRVTVTRDVGGWDVSGSTISNAAVVTFPACTGGSNTISHVGIGTSFSGAGRILYYGTLSAELAVSNGITPEFAAGALDIGEH